MRNGAVAYQGNSRDTVVLVCSVLFTIVWWHINHRSNWLPMFVVLNVLSLLTGIYAVPGVSRVATQLLRRSGSASRQSGAVTISQQRADGHNRTHR